MGKPRAVLTGWTALPRWQPAARCVRANGAAQARLGVVIGKKFAKRAVERNLIKRQCRELFRLRQPLLGGRDVLIRSVTVEPSCRSKGIGRNLVAVLLRQAFDADARTAWLLTTDAQAFFEKTGFNLVSRETAPAAILATRQAVELCPATAILLSRPITP